MQSFMSVARLRVGTSRIADGRARWREELDSSSHEPGATLTQCLVVRPTKNNTRRATDVQPVTLVRKHIVQDNRGTLKHAPFAAPRPVGGGNFFSTIGQIVFARRVIGGT